jgi:serine protease Do
VAGKKEILYRTRDSCRGKATVVAFHERDDVAVLELDLSCPRVSALPMSRTSSRAGDDVLAAGHPGGLDWSLTKGVVAHESRSLPEAGNDVKYLQLDVASFEGGSGGPVVDTQCSVVGMISRGALRGLISFAVPASIIRSKLLELNN